MGLAKVVVELESSLGRFSRLGKDCARRLVVEAEQAITVGQARIGEGIVRVLPNRFLKVHDGLADPFLGPSVPVVAAFEIRCVRLGAHRELLRQDIFLFGRKLNA